MDSLLRFTGEGIVEVVMSRVEIGQGIQTAIAQIAAEELDVSMDRIRVVAPDTALAPGGGYTAGSNSIQGLGNQMRTAAADARHILLERAAGRLEVGVEQLAVVDGEIRGLAGRATTYWELLEGKSLQDPVTGIGKVKSPAEYEVVGKPVPRLDLADRVRGARRFVHDLVLPDMLYGRVVRPSSYSSLLEEVDADSVRGLPGIVSVVRLGSFLGVVAEREEQAVTGASALREVAVWESDSSLPEPGTLYDRLLDTPGEARLVVDGVPIEGAVPDAVLPDTASVTISATYTRPYQMHAALGPSAAMALLKNPSEEGPILTVWSHTQGVHPLRGALSQVLEIPEDDIRVLHVEGAGCYGHNGADDAGLDAALLARAVPGRPVMLKWMREDEHAWEPYGSCAVLEMEASLDSEGRVVGWNHDVYSHTHGGRPRRSEGSSGLLAAWHLDPPLPAPVPRPGGGSHGGIHRNADPLYDFPCRRVVKHFVPDSPLRVSALRGPGSFANVFAIESLMDELALAASVDPVAFRLNHLSSDERARKVIQSAAELAGWVEGVRGKGSGGGQGIGFARYKNEKAYVAVVAEVSLGDAGVISLERLVIAADVGQIVNPEGVTSQLEGGAVQAASWTLKEEVQFSRERITSVDWETYPVLSFEEAPEVETVLLNQPGLPSLGCGEAAQGPTPAAIANAVFDAIGVRLRDIPFTPEKVLKCMD